MGVYRVTPNPKVVWLRPSCISQVLLYIHNTMVVFVISTILILSLTVKYLTTSTRFVEF